jgi:competence protein ComEC
MGIAHLDGLILTHPHRDHTAGLDVLLDHLPVRTLIVSDSVKFSPQREDLIRERGTNVRSVRAGDVISVDPRMRIYVLHPWLVDTRQGWNDNSVVVQVRFGATRALLTGDLEEAGEDQILAGYGDFLKSDLLKVGHHGSSTSSSPRFIDLVAPEVAIASVGWRNRFGHPSPLREAELLTRSVEVKKTSTDGAIWYRSDGHRWVQREWK